MTHVAAHYQERYYRVRDDSVGLNTDGGWLGLQNANPTITTGVTFRIRIECAETAGASSPGNPGGQLEASLSGAAYFNVTTTSTIVKAVASAFSIDGAACSTQLLTGVGTFLGTGTGCEDGSASMPNMSSQCCEVEYALQCIEADVTESDLLYLRIAGCDEYVSNAILPIQFQSFPPGPVMKSTRSHRADRFLIQR